MMRVIDVKLKSSWYKSQITYCNYTLLSGLAQQ